MLRMDEVMPLTRSWRSLPGRSCSGDVLQPRHPSGLVKGWSVDRAAVIADELGWRNYAINAGGDIRLRGGALPATVWRVGIQHPANRHDIAAVVLGDDLAVATSGAYVRGQHVFNPRTRRAPEGVLSVTITGPDLATADAFATAAFAHGRRRPCLDCARPRPRGADAHGRRPLSPYTRLPEPDGVAVRGAHPGVGWWPPKERHALIRRTASRHRRRRRSACVASPWLGIASARSHKSRKGMS